MTASRSRLLSPAFPSEYGLSFPLHLGLIHEYGIQKIGTLKKKWTLCTCLCCLCSNEEKAKDVFEGVFCVSWWYIWMFRNKIIFGNFLPERDRIFDDIVSRSYFWFSDKSNGNIDWIMTLQNPYLAFLYDLCCFVLALS